MNQTPGFNDPLIVIQLSPKCSKEALEATFLKFNGLSQVALDSENMRLRMRSSINLFIIEEEIRKVDAGAHLFQYNMEPALAPAPAPDVHPNRKSDPRNQKPMSTHAKENEGFEEDNDRKHGQEVPRRQPEFRPNGGHGNYGHKQQQEAYNNENEGFEDVREIPRNSGGNPNEFQERKSNNAKRDDQGFEDDREVPRNRGGNPNEFQERRSNNAKRDDQGFEDVREIPRNRGGNPNEFHQERRSNNAKRDDQGFEADHQYHSSNDQQKGKAYPRGYAHDREDETYVCRNYREEDEPKVSNDPNMFRNRQSEAFSRDNLRSQSCRFDERNSQQHQPPSQSHYPKYKQRTRYGSPSGAHNASNSQYYHQNEYSSRAHGRSGFVEENQNYRCPNMAPSSYDPYEQRAYYSDYPMGDPNVCNIL